MHADQYLVGGDLGLAYIPELERIRRALAVLDERFHAFLLPANSLFLQSETSNIFREIVVHLSARSGWSAVPGRGLRGASTGLWSTMDSYFKKFIACSSGPA
jgi:hypothetical protein